jgi:hypothetical protein
VIENPGRARFLLEALQAVRVGRERRRQDLDRDVAAQARVLRTVHLSHPARADRLEDLVGPEAVSRREGHLPGF